MGATLFLGQILADIRDQADINGATARHSATLLTRLVNQSHRHFRRRLSLDGAQHFLTNATGLTGSGTTSPFPFYVLDLAEFNPNIVRCFGVDITVNTHVRSLTHVPFTARNDYGNTNQTGMPVAWTILQTAQLALLPAPASAYPYAVWYLPQVDDVVNDSDPLGLVEGADEFIVWDCVTRLIMRDQYPQAFAMAVQMRDEKYREVISNAKAVSGAAGMYVGRDVLAERLNGLAHARRLPMP